MPARIYKPKKRGSQKVLRYKSSRQDRLEVHRLSRLIKKSKGPIRIHDPKQLDLIIRYMTSYPNTRSKSSLLGKARLVNKVSRLSSSSFTEPETEDYSEQDRTLLEDGIQKEWNNQEIYNGIYDQTLDNAADAIISWMNERDNYIPEQEMEQGLQQLRHHYDLTSATIDYNGGHPGIILAINPRLFIPIKATTISGVKSSPKTAIPTGDYLRATHYDGPFQTPIAELMKAWNSSYGKKVQKIGLADIALSKSQKKTVTQTSLRPGSVEAVTSVPRGTGRSGSGETAIGHMGNQQQLIMKGGSAASFNGGHLIGDQLMNSHKNFDLYEAWNLAPQHREFNSPIYSSAIEAAAAKAMSKANPIKYNVSVSYDRDVEKVQAVTAIKNILTSGSKKTAILNSLDTTHKPGTSGLPATLDFHTRIPRYWTATAKEKNSKNKMSGSISQRPTGILSNTLIAEDGDTSLATGKTFIYSVSTKVGGTSALLDSANFNKKGKQSFSGKSEITVNAQQETYTTQPPKAALGSALASGASSMTTANVAGWGANIPSNRVGAIMAWLPSNMSKAGSGLNTLLGAHGGVSGIGPATIKQISKNGFTF